MVTNIREFVRNVFLRLMWTGIDHYETRAFDRTHKLERRFGNMEVRIISIDGGPWMECGAAQRKLARILRADRKAEKDLKAEYMAERNFGV